jgi:hypothetical protein
MFCPECEARLDDCSAMGGICGNCPACGTHYIYEDLETPQEGGQLPAEHWHSELTLPEGIVWNTFPVIPGGPAIVTVTASDTALAPANIAAFREWAENEGLHTAVQRHHNVYADGIYAIRPQRLWLSPQPIVGQGYPWHPEIECPRCGETHPAYTTHCEGVGIYCRDCGAQTNDLAQRGDTLAYVGEEFLCSRCGTSCDYDGCENYARSHNRWCVEHGQSASCSVCSTLMEVAAGEDVPWRSTPEFNAICEGCMDHFCARCNRYSPYNLTHVAEIGNLCRRCWIVELTGGNEDEEFDPENTAVAELPTIEGREAIRLCGIEIEGANGTGNGNDLALALYQQELSYSDSMTGYHGGRDSGFAHVERDSTVDWEVVMGPLNAADPDDVLMVNQTVRTIRTMVKDGVLGLDLRAGCHIHVEAARVSLDGAFNLNTLFGYLEDVMFRLGAARWPVHRAIANDEYTLPVLKEERRVAFARFHENEDTHHYALSFSNYFSRMLNNCSCGAVRYDSWEDCTCSLGKCTFEFRVFNTTANPRKLHAYLALCQAMVAKAIGLGRLSDPLGEFPTQGFYCGRFKDMAPDVQESTVSEWQTRLQWMFRELPLTDEEKLSLAYCVRHSELASAGEDFINELLPQQQIQEVIA